MTSWKTPTDQQVDRAVALMMGSWEKYRYFFERLENPEWIGPLRARAFFSKPPDPIEQGDQISFPAWPESRYLSRIAGEAPQAVLDIIKDMPPTKNFRIHQDLLEAARKLPPDKAAEIAPLAEHWLANEYPGLLPEYAGEFMLMLAEGGQADAATTLLEALTEPRLREIPLTLREGQTSVRRETEPRFGGWHLKRVLDKNLPVLGARFPLATAQVLDKQLRKCLKMEQRFVDGSDGSYVWRPAIESHPQNWGEEQLKTVLTVALRDALELAAQEQPEDLRTTLERYLRDPLSIFRRLALHILRVGAPAYQDLVSNVLGEDVFADNPSVRHEYHLLLESQFAQLPEARKKRIFDRIEAGPELENYKRRSESGTGSPPSDEEVEAYGRHWQLQQLSPIAEQLTGQWKQRYESLLSEFGPPEHPEFLVWSSTTWVGPTSPKKKDQLAEMGPARTLEYLKTFEPSGDPFEDSREGLARELQTAVEGDVTGYLAVARGFLDERIHPTYVYHLVTGLHEAWKKDADVEWEMLLELFEPISKALTGEGAQLLDATVTMDDVDWPGVRMAISRFLSGALARDDERPRSGLMPKIRDILLRLIRDPDPTREDEESRTGGAMDWPSVRLNVARGVAALALLQYALRHARIHKREHEAAQADRDCARRMEPSVKSAFADMLDKEKEPSVGVHSLFGEFLPNFLFLDRDWTVAHLDKIFPSESDKRLYWESAWQGYMLYCPRVYRELYELLRPQYFRALRTLEVEDDSHAIRNARNAVAQHIAIAYRMGYEDLEPLTDGTLVPAGGGDSKISLLHAFLEMASDELRAAFVRGLGSSLRAGEDVPPEHWTRMRQCWEARTEALASAASGYEMEQELSAFASWVRGVPDKLDTLAPLIRVSTEHLATGHDAHELLEYLSEQSQCYPFLATEMLSVLIDREAVLARGPDVNRIYLIGAERYIWTILENAMGAEDAARESAISLINQLGERGDYAYRQLLRPRD